MKETKYAETVNEFMELLKEYHADYIKSHQRHMTDTPINYEIGRGIISASYIIDIRLTFGKSDLFDLMNEIADYTNNEFRCGCSFTMA